MARGKFWKKLANIFIITLQLTWSCIIFTFVILPRLIILPCRREIFRIRIQRKLVKNGMPRKDGKSFAKKYQSMLKDYGSILGLLKIINKNRTRSTDDDENKISEPKKETGKKLKTFSVLI